MLKLKVKGTEYKLKFGYKSLKRTNILKEVTEMQNKLQKSRAGSEGDFENAELFDEVLDVCSKLVLAALQKYHEEFRADYKKPDSVQAQIDKVDDFIDDYMDEGDSMSIMDLFQVLAEELYNDGFLSKKSAAQTEAQEMEAATDTAENVVPMIEAKV